MAGPTIRENPLTTRRFQARAIGRDPGISGQGIMASGPWKGRINRSKTWPHPNSAAATQTELANGAPSRQGGELTLGRCVESVDYRLIDDARTSSRHSL